MPATNPHGIPIKIGFLGAGKMATALAAALSRRTVLRAKSSPRSVSNGAENFANEVGAISGTSNTEVAQFAAGVDSRHQPDQVAAVLAEIPARSPKSICSSPIAAA